MGETRVDLLHLLEDLRDAYPGMLEETILTEMVANSLDSGASRIVLKANPSEGTLMVLDNGSSYELAFYKLTGSIAYIKDKQAQVELVSGVTFDDFWWMDFTDRTHMRSINYYPGEPHDFSYLWNDGSTSNLIENLASGEYALEATDINGCSVTSVYELGEPDACGGPRSPDSGVAAAN